MTPAERNRLRTFGNLWRSLVPLVAIIVLLLIFVLPRGSDSQKVRTVDAAAAISFAKSIAAYPLLEPHGLGTGWRPTSTTLLRPPDGMRSPFTFGVGYVTPKGDFAQFRESDDDAQDVLTTLGKTTPLAPRTIDGVPWSALKNSRDEVVLVRTVATVTVYVTGSASDAELAELARSLR